MDHWQRRYVSVTAQIDLARLMIGLFQPTERPSHLAVAIHNDLNEVDLTNQTQHLIFWSMQLISPNSTKSHFLDPSKNIIIIIFLKFLLR